MPHRNNEAARGLSEFNSTKIEIAKQDQRFVIEQNIENKVFRKYQVARQMWESVTSANDKKMRFNRMNAWAAKIDGDDYDDLTLAKQPEAPTIDHHRSTPKTNTKASSSVTHSIDKNYNSICSSTYSEQKAGSSLSHQQQALSANSHQQKEAIKSNQQKQVSTNSQQQKVSSTSNQRQKGSSEISVVKQKMVFTEVVPKEESSSSDSESDTESFKAEVIIRAKKQREIMEMFREKIKPVTAGRERIVQAVINGDQTPKIVSLRDAISSHYKKSQEISDTIILLPPDVATTSQPTNSQPTTVTSLINSKVSQVTTRRADKTRKQIKKVNLINTSLSSHFTSSRRPYHIFYFPSFMKMYH